MKSIIFILLAAVVSYSQISSGTVRRDSVQSYVNFNAYVAAKGVQVISPFFATNTLYVTGKLTVPSNIDLAGFLNGAKFAGNTGSATDTVVVSIMSADPAHQIFDTSITVQFAPGAVSAVRPEWWGDSINGVLKAIQCAQRSNIKVVELLKKYRVTSTLLIDGTYPISIVGKGDSTGFYTTDSSIIVLKCKTASSSFENFSITMNDSAVVRATGGDSDYGYPVGLMVFKADGCNIENIKILGGHSEGILIHSSNYCKVYSCETNGTAYQGIMTFESYDIEIKNNVCHGLSVNGASGIRTERGHKSKIVGNTCYGLSTNGIRIEDTYGTLIDGNMCYNNGQSGIFIYGPQSGYAASTANNIISNNICFDNCSPTGYSSVEIGQGGGGIEIRGDVDNNTITNNRCYNTKTIEVLDDFETITDWTAANGTVLTAQVRTAQSNANVCRVTQGDTSLLINCSSFSGASGKGVLAFKNIPAGIDLSGYEYLTLSVWHTTTYTKYDCIKLYSAVDTGGTVLDSIPLTFESQKSGFMQPHKLTDPAILTSVKCVAFYRANATAGTQNIIVDYLVAGVAQWWGIVSGLLYHDTKTPFNNSISGNHLDSNKILPIREFQSVGFNSNSKIYGKQFFASDSPSTSTTTGALIISGGVGIAKSVFIGDDLHVADSLHAVNAARTNRLYYGIAKGDSLQIGASGAVIKQFWKDGDSLKVLIGADTLAWKPD